ncbi:MAG: hypothetical protein U0353_15885 [Sandaracinus sp.]
MLRTSIWTVHLLPLLLLLALAPGCEGSGSPDASAPDARVIRDAARPDVGPLDAFVASGPDATCGQTEPDPDRTVQCSPCDPTCFVTREQPRAGQPAGEGLEHDATLDGVRLAHAASGSGYVAEGRHERVHDGTLSCDPRTSLSEWRTIDYDVEIPAGTAIDFELRVASSEAALATAMPATVPAMQGHGVIDVAFALLTSGAPTSGPFFSVTVVLHASADGSASPVLRRYDLRYSCVPGI